LLRFSLQIFSIGFISKANKREENGTGIINQTDIWSV
jgi:hypothetical protein